MYNVTVREPLRASDRTALEAIGSGVASYEPPNVFRMFLLPDELARVQALDFVTGATPYTLEETVTPDLMDMVPTAGTRAPGEEETFDVLLHRGRDHDRVVAAVEAAGGRVVDGEARHMIRIAIPMDVAALGALAQLPQVRRITPFQAPSLLADRARVLVGIDALNQAPAGQPAQQLTGAGETVAIFDSGVDAEHPDLKDRIKATVRFQNAPVVDTVGHGTHVAGIIAGTGAASGGKIRGVAPGAALVVVGMVNASGQLLIPPDLRDLLKEAVTDAHGAKIINLSWGNKFASEYEFGSLQLDWFVYEHEDVLVVVAAGNSGKLNGQGRYEFSSIGTPATAKNALTVGACGSDRAGIPLRWSDEPWSIPSPQGDYAMCSADSVAVLSSRGPSDYDSVKPDVCACGIYVASARAAQARMKYWAPDPAQFADRYGYLGGTSMATPVVSGAAAVLREYLRVKQDRATPTAALLKAILIASARRLDSFKKEMGYPLEAEVGYPNFHQGFGRIDLSTVLPHAGAPTRKLLCDDVRNGTDRGLQAQAPVDSTHAAARTYTVKVAQNAAEPLTVVLAWTDYPGKFLHNNLQLYVEGPGGVSVGNSELTYHRDAFATDALARGAAPDEVKFVKVPLDKYNNVEQVRIANPAAGKYRIVVLAQYTDPEVPAQGYALCVSGGLESDQLSEG
jgi:subtilisin family serine protease